MSATTALHGYRSQTGCLFHGRPRFFPSATSHHKVARHEAPPLLSCELGGGHAGEHSSDFRCAEPYTRGREIQIVSKPRRLSGAVRGAITSRGSLTRHRPPPLPPLLLFLCVRGYVRFSRTNSSCRDSRHFQLHATGRGAGQSMGAARAARAAAAAVTTQTTGDRVLAGTRCRVRGHGGGLVVCGLGPASSLWHAPLLHCRS